MPTDDYHVIVFKVLLYLYGVLKRNIRYEEETFQAVLEKQEISNEYFYDVLNMMEKDGLIENVKFIKAWGGDVILVSDLKDMKITPKGIEYLKENSMMQKIKDGFSETIGLVGNLIQIVKFK